MKRFFSLIILLVAVVLLYPTERANGQWKQIASFTSTTNSIVECIYFLNDVGQPEIGFVTLKGGEIWRTSDGGTTWSFIKRINPTNSVWGVTAFSFKDDQTGWLSVYQDGVSGCYKTTDGGLSWQDLRINSFASAVHYHSPTRLLFLVSAGGTTKVSSDEGNTWTNSSTANMNSVAFASDLIGVLCPYNGAHFYFTADGGKSWNESTQTAECWSVLAIKGSSTFFAVPEGKGNVLRSDNGGQTWMTIPNIKFGGTTGDVQGDLSHLFIQQLSTSGGTGGLFVSTDGGQIWNAMSGPRNYVDTRFFVRCGVIFAGDDFGGVWKNVYDSLVTSELRAIITPITLDFPSAENCRDHDSVIRLSHFASCGGDRPTTIVAATLNGSPNFEAILPTFPHIITTKDSIPIRFHALSRGSESAALTLRIDLDGRIMDTVIQLSAFVTHGTRQLAYDTSAIAFGTLTVCESRDTVIVLRNTGCDTLTLQGYRVQGLGYRMLDSLPSILLPNDSVRVRFATELDTLGHPMSHTASVKFLSNSDDTSLRPIVFTRNIIYPPHLDLRLEALNETVHAGDTIEIPVYINGGMQTVTLSGSTTIQLGFKLNMNITQPIEFVPIILGFTAPARLTFSNGGANVMLDAPNGFTVTGETLIGKLRCVVYLSDTLETQISLDSSSFSSVDSRCAILSQNAGATTIQLVGCGYSTLARYMRTGNIVGFTAAPNPFAGEISVAAKLSASAMLRLDIFNEIGTQIYSEGLGFTQAGRDAHMRVSTKGWSSGVYYARLSTSGGEVRTVKLVKE